MDLCIECKANQVSGTSEECTMTWRLQLRILLTLQIAVAKDPSACPVDNREWEFQKYGR
ncbi:hypothetical protein PsorP6_002199 [Peronosclerospora sorghi]|uniref:Uncharacterized protein n=1 Tax=Peronosclerospora sorghi TaxID=230839 RepID=A0ACC0WYB6_9STRA|nr:hypothetical protein PsorP6_002199 [Peronosclerospora sorghi]